MSRHETNGTVRMILILAVLFFSWLLVALYKWGWIFKQTEV